MYAAIAVVAAVAIIAVAWFVLQPGEVTLESMKKSLKDKDYEGVKDIPGVLPGGAVGGIQFDYFDGDHHDVTVFIYEFESESAASGYAVGKTVLVNGVFVLALDHHHGAIDNDIKSLFNKLVSGKSIPWNTHAGHDH